MAKIQQFKNKPTPYIFGQYYYENDDMDNFQPLEESDSIKKPVDKYSDKSLHSSVVSDETRESIVQNRLRFIGNSGITINDLQVKSSGTTRAHIDCSFRGFVCDRKTFDCFDDVGSLRGYNTIFDFFRKTSEDDNNKETCQFFRHNPSTISEGSAPDFDFLKNKNIIQNLSPDLTSGLKLQGGDYLTDDQRDIDFGIQNMIDSGKNLWDSGVAKGNFIPFRPNDNIGLDDQSERLTSIFSENALLNNTFDNTGGNYIQIVLWFKSNQSETGNIRNRRFYVLKVNPNELMNLDGDKATPGELADTAIVGNNDNIPHRDGHRTESDTNTAAWYLSNFSVTFNIQAGVSADSFGPQYLPILQKIEPRNPIIENDFDLNFTSVNLLQEPFTSATDTIQVGLWRKNFTPFSQITIDGRFDKNLQGFKIDTLDRQICSSPGAVNLKVGIAAHNKTDDDNEIIIEKAYPNNISPHYKVCIVHWDDVNDEFETVQDVFDKKPINFNEVLIAQDNNTFIFKDFINTFNNNYTTPGIKKIKILVFNYVEYLNPNWSNSYYNYEMPPFDKIEPMRYKLLTSRIFLDIPISEFEDFGELGGAEYRTLPWPHTNPIINGISKDSKYLKSINNIVGGGKIGNQDIIDETFLLEAQENDELGETIELMDLEQVRYFNKSYDMNTLLLIPTAGVSGWGDYELAKQSSIFIAGPSYNTSYIGNLGNWSNVDFEIVFNGTNEYEMYMNNSNTFNNILLKNEVVFEGGTTSPLILPYKTYGPSLNIESFTSEEAVSEFFKNENFTPTLDELEEEGQTNSGFIKTRQNGSSTYYPGYGWFGAVTDAGLMSTFQSGPEVYEEAAPRINFNPDETSSTVNRIQFLNPSSQDTQFSHPNFPLLFYYNIDEELYEENGEYRLGDLQMGESIPFPAGKFVFVLVPDKLYTSDLNGEIQFLNESISIQDFSQLPIAKDIIIPHPYTEREFWNADPNYSGKRFPEESSVGQIFISDNQDSDLKQSCELELNTGELLDKSIYDSSGKGNKGLLIGDYKIKKNKKGERMRKDSSIKTPQKVGNNNGAL